MIKLEVPGFESKDISIELEKDLLTISCAKNEKSYKVPEDVDVENISAETKNGILSVTLPLKEKRKKRNETEDRGQVKRRGDQLSSFFLLIQKKKKRKK